MAGADQLRAIDEWRVRVEDTPTEGRVRVWRVRVKGAPTEGRVRGEGAEGASAKTRTRRRRRTSTANAICGCVSPREPKAANTIRINDATRRRRN